MSVRHGSYQSVLMIILEFGTNRCILIFNIHKLLIFFVKILNDFDFQRFYLNSDVFGEQLKSYEQKKMITITILYLK